MVSDKNVLDLNLPVPEEDDIFSTHFPQRLDEKCPQQNNHAQGSKNKMKIKLVESDYYAGESRSPPKSNMVSDRNVLDLNLPVPEEDDIFSTHFTQRLDEKCPQQNNHAQGSKNKMKIKLVESDYHAGESRSPPKSNMVSDRNVLGLNMKPVEKEDDISSTHFPRRLDEKCLAHDNHAQGRKNKMKNIVTSENPVKKVKYLVEFEGRRVENEILHKIRKKEKKDALHQLVSPIGKMDMASVLKETRNHIKNLHDKIQVQIDQVSQRGLAIVHVDVIHKIVHQNTLK